MDKLDLKIGYSEKKKLKYKDYRAIEYKENNCMHDYSKLT